MASQNPNPPNPLAGEHLATRALVHAAQRGDLGELQRILDYLSARYQLSKGHVLIYSKDENHDSALHKAVHLGLVDILDYLLSDDVFPLAPGLKAMFMELRNRDSNTAVHLAVEMGQLPYLQRLVQNGANTVVANHFNWPPLQIASHAYLSSCVETARLRAISFAPGSLPFLDPGNDDRHLAVIVWLLTYTRPNINAQNNVGDTALHMAARMKNANLIETLIVAGAQIDMPNFGGYTPLHLTVLGPGNLDCASRFLLRHVNPNTQEYNLGYAPIHSAVVDHNVNMIELLLEHGADEWLRNRNGLRPWQLAQLRSEEASAFFINRMSDLSRQNQ